MANQGGGSSSSTVVVLAFWGRLLRGAGGMEGWAEAGMGVEVWLATMARKPVDYDL